MLDIVGPTEAAAQLGLRKSTVSEQARRFEAAGLLTRLPDGRFSYRAFLIARQMSGQPMKSRKLLATQDADGAAPTPDRPVEGAAVQVAAVNPQNERAAIQTEALRFKLARERGEYLPRDAVAREAATAGMVLRNALGQLGARLADELVVMTDRGEIQALIDRHVTDALTSCASHLSALSAESDDTAEAA